MSTQAIAAATTRLHVGYLGGRVDGEGLPAFHMKGWENVEADHIPGWPVPVNYYREIFVRDCLERFTFEEGQKLMQAMFTALAPGGKITVVCQDVRKSCQALITGKAPVKEWFEQIMMGYDRGEKSDRKQRYHAMYDMDDLYELMIASGFIWMTPMDFMTCSLIPVRSPILMGFEGYKPL